MSKSNIFVGIAISFAVGVFLASRFGIPGMYLYAYLALAVSVFAIAYLSAATKAILGALFLFCAGLGALRLQTSNVPNEYQNLFNQKQKLEGYITEDIDLRADRQLITFLPKGYDQKLLVTTTKANDYFYGDWIVVEGKITQAKEFEDFDYPKYLERYDIYGLVRYPRILVLKNHQGNWLKEQILHVKYAAIKRINEVMPEPKSSLLLGILIGARKGLPQNITDDFTVVGLSHIVAVSGYNISIIIGALGGFLAKLFGRRLSFWLSLLVIAGFVVISGASASVIRAAVMGVLLLLSFNIGRLYVITPSIMFAGLVMIALNPKILYWDTGFQLSFLATIGIVYFMPVLEQLTEKWPRLGKLKDIFLTTMAAIVATMPLILFDFGRLSIVAPIVNILVLPFVPAVMLFGFLAVLPLVGPGFGLVAAGLLIYILKITEWFGGLSYASMEIKISGPMFVMLCLAVVLLYFLLKRLAGKIRVEEARIL